MWVAVNWIDDHVCTGRVAKNVDTDRPNPAAEAVHDLAAKARARATHHHADVHIRESDDKPDEITFDKNQNNNELWIANTQ